MNGYLLTEKEIPVLMTVWLQLTLLLVCVRICYSFVSNIKRIYYAKKKVAIDCEMVGCFPNENENIKQRPVAAQCAIVDYNSKVLYHSYIHPNRRVKSYLFLDPEKVQNGVPFDTARRKILEEKKLLLDITLIMILIHWKLFGGLTSKNRILLRTSYYVTRLKMQEL